MNKWTGLFVKLNGQMKKIGNVNPSTGAISMYAEGLAYYDSGDLYFVNKQGLYQQYD